MATRRSESAVGKFERGKMNYNGDIRKGEKEQLLKEVLSGLDCMRLTKHVC